MIVCPSLVPNEQYYDPDVPGFQTGITLATRSYDKAGRLVSSATSTNVPGAYLIALYGTDANGKTVATFAGLNDAARMAWTSGFTQLPEGGLIMCHPGFVDAELERLDPLTTLREREYAYFCSDRFVEVLKAHDLTLN